LFREDVWAELERRAVAVAIVPFSGRAEAGGSIGTIAMRRRGHGDAEFERWTDERDELPFALEAVVWERFGSFAGQPSVRGTVAWRVPARRIVIAGRRGDEVFEELVP
jgi:hypothetical protein